MPDTRKVIIYNGPGTAEISVDDLYTFFITSEKIFPSRPDVLKDDFDFNLSGLTDPVFVVPGGSTSAIGMRLKPQIDKIKSHFQENFSYVGVCAGAYLGAANADLYVTTYDLDETGKKFLEPLYITSTTRVKIACNIIENYRAIGAFYPNNNYLGATLKKRIPYRVSLAMNYSHKELSQLYLEGPGFISDSKGEEKTSSDVVATYMGYEKFSLFNTEPTKTIKSLAAIVRTPPQHKIGGKLLVGTHFETCVQGSKLLSFLEKERPCNAALAKEEYALFLKEQKETQTYFESLLSDTVKLTPR